MIPISCHEITRSHATYRTCLKCHMIEGEREGDRQRERESVRKSRRNRVRKKQKVSETERMTKYDAAT